MKSTIIVEKSPLLIIENRISTEKMASEVQESENVSESKVSQIKNKVEDSDDIVKKKLETSKKKPRKRHRELHASILKQMEFYFGDVNLSKDRFLSKLISEDPWVDLNVFIKFNKIRALTTDVSRIAKALRNSKVLAISEDETKVSRITPIQPKENSEECTIYVQRLPPEADHDWISMIFSKYGQIDYISIPKYKNKAIKGFAFIEFKDQESAAKCIKEFRVKGCELPSLSSPDSLMSITTHEDCDKGIVKESNLDKVKNEEINMETESDKELKSKRESKPQVSESGKKKKKRKRASNEDFVSVNDEVEEHKLNKKKKFNNVDSERFQLNTLKSEKEQKRSKKRKFKSQDASISLDKSDELNNSYVSEGEKKIRKLKYESSSAELNISIKETDSELKSDLKETNLKLDYLKDADSKLNDNSREECEWQSGETFKSNKYISKNVQEQESKEREKRKRKRKRTGRKDETDGTEIGLEIMAKKEWKKLRNKYLEMQRAKMKQLKQHLRKAAWNQWQDTEKIPEDEEIKETEPKENKTARFSFTPGVILKIQLETPCSDPKSFKMELKGNDCVKYVDINEGSNVAYVRCDNAESAKLLAEKSSDERSIIILEGQDEKSYWEKIARDREEKIGSNIRVKQRGRGKLLKKAEKELGKHIKFDKVNKLV